MVVGHDHAGTPPPDLSNKDHPHVTRSRSSNNASNTTSTPLPGSVGMVTFPLTGLDTTTTLTASTPGLRTGPKMKSLLPQLNGTSEPVVQTTTNSTTIPMSPHVPTFSLFQKRGKQHHIVQELKSQATPQDIQTVGQTQPFLTEDTTVSKQMFAKTWTPPTASLSAPSIPEQLTTEDALATEKHHEQSKTEDTLATETPTVLEQSTTKDTLATETPTVFEQSRTKDALATATPTVLEQSTTKDTLATETQHEQSTTEHTLATETTTVLEQSTTKDTLATETPKSLSETVVPSTDVIKVKEEPGDEEQGTKLPTPPSRHLPFTDRLITHVPTNETRVQERIRKLREQMNLASIQVDNVRKSLQGND